MANKLSNAVKSALAAVKPMLFDDTLFSDSATYKIYSGVSYSAVNQEQTRTYTSVSVTALVLGEPTHKGKVRESELEGKSASILIKQSDFSGVDGGFDLTDVVSDQVVLNSKTFKVQSAEAILDELYLFELGE